MTKEPIDKPANKDEREKVLRKIDDLFTELVELGLDEDSDFATREEEVLDSLNEVGRRHLRSRLQAMSDGFDDLLRIKSYNGEPDDIVEKLSLNCRTYRHHHRARNTYFTLCGPLEIWRSTYREVGVRNGPTVVPLDLKAGLAEDLSWPLAKSVELGYSKGPLRSYIEDMELTHRHSPPRATLERKAKKIAAKAAASVVFIENAIRSEERVPDNAVAACLGIDRSAVPMAEPCENGRRRRRDRPYQRKQPPPTTVNWRMDYVATMSFVDAEGEAILTRRYHLAHDQPGDRVADRILSDLAHGLEQRSDLRVVVVQDGAPEMWNVMRAAFERFNIPMGDEVLDWYHASERVGACLLLVENDDQARSKLRQQWTDRLLNEKQAASRFIASLRRRRACLSKAARSELDTHVRYFAERKHLMHYAEMRKQKLPIGSGATEGACKSLIAARAKRSGQRWSRPGLNAVLSLRAIHQSGRFEPFWARFAAAYRAAEIRPA